MKTQLLQTVLALAMAFAACPGVQAQEKKEYPKPEAMRPGMSEYWTPQPKVVTPGDIKTNSAPNDAIVLFDGKDRSAWTHTDGTPAAWTVKNGVVTVDKSKGDIITKQKFGSCQLHIEWCVPKDIEGESQARGNSGVFLQDTYEVQILDCYGNETYVNGMTGRANGTSTTSSTRHLSSRRTAHTSIAPMLRSYRTASSCRTIPRYREPPSTSASPAQSGTATDQSVCSRMATPASPSASAIYGFAPSEAG